MADRKFAIAQVLAAAAVEVALTNLVAGQSCCLQASSRRLR